MIKFLILLQINGWGWTHARYEKNIESAAIHARDSKNDNADREITLGNYPLVAVICDIIERWDLFGKFSVLSLPWLVSF